MAFWDFFWALLGQFVGGPGSRENNLVRFGIPAILWAILLWVAWSRQRQQELPREKLLVWGFGIGFVREAFMFLHIASKILTGTEKDACIVEPLEHALAMAAVIVIAAAFLRYILDDAALARRYLRIGLGVTVICYLVTFLWWPRYSMQHPEVNFHQSWFSWLFHIASPVLIAWAIYALNRGQGWLRSVVSLALLLFLLGEAIMIVNFATNKAYDYIFCRIANTFHILATPILGYVYFREQTLEKEAADAQVKAYRDHLEELVDVRTTELTRTNAQLQQEIGERQLAQEALVRLSHRNQLILESAGEGIFGIDRQGRHIFVNPAAAEMLGYTVEELIGRPSHSTWHYAYPDGTPYPEVECPIHAGYKVGVGRSGDDQTFWRKDGSSFPTRFVSTPIYQGEGLMGAVVVFQDITERKRFEDEITCSNMELAVQNTIAATISQSLHLDAILNTALDTVLSIFGLQSGVIFLLDSLDNVLTRQVYRSTTLTEMPLPAARPLRLDECWCGQAILEMRPLVIRTAELPEADKEESIKQTIAPDQAQILICSPLIARGNAVGVLMMSTQYPDAVPPHRLELLTAIGQQIGMAVENARLYEETENLAEQLTMLHQANIALSGPLSLAQLYIQIAAVATKLLNCQIACLYTWDDETHVAENVATYTSDPSEIEELDIPLDILPCLQALTTHRLSIAIEDGQSDPRVPAQWQRALSARAILCMPLWTKRKALGFLFVVDQRAPRRWRPDEIILGQSYANRAAMTLENAYLNHEIQKTATMHERERIAAELHDGVGQTLSYMGLQVDQVMQLEGIVQHPQGEPQLEGVRRAVNQATRELRAAIDHLLSRQPPRKALHELLNDIVQTFAAERQTPVHLVDNTNALLFLPPDKNEQVMRIVQEALSNAARHARPQHIDVTLKQQNHTTVITIADDGCGFDPAAVQHNSGHHFGLSIMQARAARIDGHVTVESAPGQGARVILSFPGG